MPELFDYLSWNIQQFSVKHGARQLLMNVSVSAWIAGLVLDLQANVVGVMEVTVGTGEAAVTELVNSVNVTIDGGGKTKYFAMVVSGASATKKADKYAVIYCTKQFTMTMGGGSYTFNPVAVSNAKIEAGSGIKWEDRAPFYWLTGSGASAVNTLIWHAPAPNNHLKAVTIQHMADLAAQIAKSTGSKRFCISGDFNFDTASTTVYAPLVKLGFTGAFDGELTTLTTLKSFIANNKEKFVNAKQYDAAFLASAYDNIFTSVVNFTNHVRPIVPAMILEEIMTNIKFQMVTRSKAAEALAQARQISDHLPLVATIFE